MFEVQNPSCEGPNPDRELRVQASRLGCTQILNVPQTNQHPSGGRGEAVIPNPPGSQPVEPLGVRFHPVSIMARPNLRRATTPLGFGEIGNRPALRARAGDFKDCSIHGDVEHGSDFGLNSSMNRLSMIVSGKVHTDSLRMVWKSSQTILSRVDSYLPWGSYQKYGASSPGRGSMPSVSESRP